MGGELFELFARLTLDSSEFDKGVSQSTEKASMFGDILKADLVGKGITAAFNGLKKLGGAVKDFTSNAVSGYAEYEQLSGGIQKLFGAGGLTLEQYAEQQGETVDAISDKYYDLMQAQDIVMDHANEAYKTAGMSANEYMEAVSGFSAALTNSLGGDTVKAAEKADVAMRAISDNINTFGTDMASVQNAFQGFAKQNYTMLDNLKLGYGGTKSEMQRLIDDANEYGKTIDMAGDLSMDSFADIITAIELIQEKQGIAGTTAREASKTIEGSVNAAKSAWQNFVAGIANPDADMGQLITNLVDSSTTALHNIVPAVGRALSGIGSAVSKITPVVMEELPKMFSDVAPALADSALEMVESIGDVFSDNAGNLLDAGIEWVNGLSEGVQEAMPEFTENFLTWITEAFTALSDGGGALLETGASFLQSLSQGIVDSFPILMEKLPELFAQVTAWITENATMLVNTGAAILGQLGAGLTQGLPQLLEMILPMVTQLSENIRSNAGTMVDAGLQLILNLAQGIMNSLPALIEQIPQIVINIAGVINDNAPKVLLAGFQLLVTLGKGIIEAIPTLIENIPQIFEAIIAVWSALNWTSLGKNVINWIKNGFNALRSNLPNTLKSIGQSAVDFFKGIDWANLGSEAINLIAGALNAAFTTIPAILLDIANDAWNAFVNVDWSDVGSKAIEGIVNGLKAGVGWIKEAAADAARSALDRAKDILGIKSPSRVFRDEVGMMIGRGMALGIDDSESYVDKAISALNTELNDGIGAINMPAIEMAPTAYIKGKNAMSDGKVVYITNNIQVDGAESPESYAHRLVQQLELEMRTA